MKYLIDTHILIWLAISPEKISKSIFDIIIDTDNKICVSTISFWEIAIKLIVNKLDLQGIGINDLIKICNTQNISIIEFPIDAALQYRQLPLKENHRDPFDRGLISICMAEGYTFLTHDNKISQYEIDGLKYIN
ncbi:MAG: type II toxin-antitoxin system VapC family toxin [Bacteroidales bacterium]|nr:type II toxin-antitoxin system VapC family toxin [Bacteroidales bacterium]